MLKWKRVEPHHLGLYEASPPGATFSVERSSEVSGSDPIWTLTMRSTFRSLKNAKAAAQTIIDNELDALARRLGA